MAEKDTVNEIESYYGSNDRPGPFFSKETYQAERDHYLGIIHAFLYYRTSCYERIEEVKNNYFQLPVAHRCMLPSYPHHLTALQNAVDVNYRLLEEIVTSSEGVFKNLMDLSKSPDRSCSEDSMYPASSFDMHKVGTTIKQFYRDWSRSGQAERDCCYKPIVEELRSLFPIKPEAAQSVRVLVPGAGLGRLAWEIAKLGYRCEGNEFSLYMLLGSNFILNRSLPVQSVTIHPWVMRFTNNVSNQHQLEAVTIPDVVTADLPSLGDFSMSAGNFLEVYQTADAWDCVATCFFIDTANNIINYMEKIYDILKPGGYWINMGPLLYHFADVATEFSIEMSYKDVRRIAEENIGFTFLKQNECVPCTYINDPQCMMQTFYKCAFSVAQKPTSKSLMP